MHENRETSLASAQADRSGKANSHKPDEYAREGSDCAVVPMRQPNKGAKALAEVVEGRAQTKENDAEPGTSAKGRGGPNVCNCLIDEGRPLGTGWQEQVPNHLRRLWSKAMVVSTEGKGLERTMSGDWQGEDRKGTTDYVSKA